jgi:hypothetical protein
MWNNLLCFKSFSNSEVPLSNVNTKYLKMLTQRVMFGTLK